MPKTLWGRKLSKKRFSGSGKPEKEKQVDGGTKMETASTGIGTSGGGAGGNKNDRRNSRENGDRRGPRNSQVWGSQWDQGMMALESVLETAKLTDEQAKGLEGLRTMLLRGHHRRQSSFVPRDLLDSAVYSGDANDGADGGGGGGGGDVDVENDGSISGRRQVRSERTRSTSTECTDYLAAEFGGVRGGVSKASSARKKLLSIMHAHSFARGLSVSLLATKSAQARRAEHQRTFSPPEWRWLEPASRLRVCELLSWESLGRWDFDVFDLVEATGGRSPLLLMGWAVMGSPQAQAVMVADCLADEAAAGAGSGDETCRESARPRDGSDSDGACIPHGATGEDGSSDGAGYDFGTGLGVDYDKLCDFLRAIESGYRPENPYHNNVHAADVVQTTHSLLQMGARHYARGDADLFALLLAAVVHDVGHPGKNNAYQVNARTDVALVYNDRSVLENMHSSRAFDILLGSDSHHKCENSRSRPRVDLLSCFDPTTELPDVRRTMIATVLATDMSSHFSQVSALRGRLATTGADPEKFKSDDEDGEAVRDVLSFVLHMADISNPAKPGPALFVEWADRCLREFFAQGDAEKAAGLPVSPLCDRDRTDLADSQIGFIEFVVKPSYEVMGDLVPRVAEEVVPVIESNLDYWKERKRQSEEQAQVEMQVQTEGQEKEQSPKMNSGQ